MLGQIFDGSWTLAHCETCMKNAHEKIKMVREKIFDVDMWVCPNCASTKRL